MLSIKNLIMGLAALLVLPVSMHLSAQGPVPISPKQERQSGPTVPANDDSRQEPTPLDAKDLEAWLDGFLPYALERGKIAGAVVVVVRGDGVVLQKGYGYADIASHKPVSPENTLFRPGSVSKLLTWTAVMQQVEEGRIDLDKDVNAYLEFKIPPFKGKPVTMRDLMTHTAGFEESLRYLVIRDAKGLIPLGELMKKSLPKRVFAPGTTPAYSNYGAALAGHIVERVSGISFDKYVEQRIFAPLGMQHSSFRQPLPDRLKPLMASGYANATEKAKPYELVGPVPAGSMAASGADMGKFMMAHLNDGAPLLKPETAKLMHDFRGPALGPLDTMALGFYEQWVNGRRAIAHGGDTQWFHSYLWLFPKDDIGLFISMNSAGREGAATPIRSALFHKFADRYLPGPALKTGKVDEATTRKHAKMMAGRYVNSRGSFTNFLSLLGLLGQVEIVVDEDGHMAFPALDGISASPRDWVEIEPFVWRDANTGERLAAEVRDGKVVRVSLDPISPFMVFEPVSPAFNATWLMPALIAALVITLLTALAWPVTALVRRHFGAQLPLHGRARSAYRFSRGFAWAVLAAVAGWMGLISIFSSDMTLVGGAMDWLIYTLRVLTPIAALGLMVSAGWYFYLNWKAKRGWIARLGSLLLALAGLILTWVTFGAHLYGFGMIY